MSSRPTWTDLLGRELGAPLRNHHADGAPAWSARLSARLFAARYDRQIDACVPAEPGSALAVHCARLSSARERAELSRALRLAVADAERGDVWGNRRIPVQGAAVTHAADVIADVLSRLDVSPAARVRGMARLRLLLSDGCGPLYRSGAGSLGAALRGVLAAM